MLKNFTWSQKGGTKKGRIDMAMASPGLLTHTVKKYPDQNPAITRTTADYTVIAGFQYGGF